MMLMMKERKLGDIITDLEDVRRRLAERKAAAAAQTTDWSTDGHSVRSHQVVVEPQQAPLDLCQRRWFVSQQHQQESGWSTNNEPTASAGKLHYTLH